MCNFLRACLYEDVGSPAFHYRQLKATMWMLGIKQESWRAVSALNP